MISSVRFLGGPTLLFERPRYAVSVGVISSASKAYERIAGLVYDSVC